MPRAPFLLLLGRTQPHSAEQPLLSGSLHKAGDPLSRAPPCSTLPSPSPAQYAARSLWALGRNSSFHTSFPAAAAEPPAAPSPSPLGCPHPHPLASAPQLALGPLGARCCPCALGTAHGHRTLSPGNRSFVTTCPPCTLSTNPWHDASSPLHCSLITDCHPCPLGSSRASLPPWLSSFPRGAPNCQPSQTPPACSALSPSQEKLCFSPRRWSLASQPAWGWGAPCCSRCCSTEGCLALGVLRSGRVNRQGLGGEGAAGATWSDQYGVLEPRTNCSSEP